MISPDRIAIVHDWLVSMRGGERVLESLCRLFPKATLFTLVHRNGSTSDPIERMKIQTSFINSMPFGLRHYQHYLPFFPAAARTFSLTGFDLVISSSSAWAKSVRIPDGAIHICYCHTPMRYIWDQYDDYFGTPRSGPLVRMAMKFLRRPLQRWDTRTAAGVTEFVANSKNVQERISRIYGRESTVIYPPVDIERFSRSDRDEGYYLIVSALVPYKRTDVAVRAFTKLGLPLVVIGSGSEQTSLRRMAGSNVKFLGWVNDDKVASYYAGCRALVFPGVEDFGIVPLEAMASGKPVVAYAGGGARETVIEAVTGVLYDDQTPGALIDAIDRFRSTRFDPRQIRKHSEQFNRNRFEEEMPNFVRKACRRHGTEL